MNPKDKRLLEIGAGNSQWLPYFAKEFGFEVTGLDYSQLGCQQAQQNLAEEGVKGDVILADFFDPPETMLSTFDVVVSFGVVEHFENTQQCLSAIARFLKPGGIMFTLIPNLLGLIGKLQTILDRDTYDLHVPMDQSNLQRAHEQASLNVLDCRYFIFSDFGVCNINNLPHESKEYALKRTLLRVIVQLTLPFWVIEEYTRILKPNRLTSPYVICVAGK